MDRLDITVPTIDANAFIACMSEYGQLAHLIYLISSSALTVLHSGGSSPYLFAGGQSYFNLMGRA